jgi:glycosyltransferase involved in cell wall biosynthesis
MGSNKGWTIASAINGLAYPYFEYLVWKRFGDAIGGGEYDIVHRVTPLTPTVNSGLANHCQRAGVPFVMGPINGGLPWPKGFRHEQSLEREWLSSVRTVYKLKPGRLKSLRNTSAIIVGSEYTRSELPEEFQEKTIYIPENAIDPEKFDRKLSPGNPEILRACFVGRLVPYKCPDIVIEAAYPSLKRGAMQLDVVGDGPLRESLQNLCRQFGIEESVRFHGNVSHENVQDIMANSDILAFPSIREFGGGVVLEAMALGVVPIVVDYGGPGELVTSDSGIKLPLGSKQEITQALTQTLENLQRDRAFLPAMASAAKSRINDYFTWDCKAAQILQVYEWVMRGDGKSPPIFFSTE